jgi:hypothetical protein
MNPLSKVVNSFDTPVMQNHSFNKKNFSESDKKIIYVQILVQI